MIEVSVQDVGNAKVLSITGDVDLYSSPEVRKELMALTDQKVKNILVDLQDQRQKLWKLLPDIR